MAIYHIDDHSLTPLSATTFANAGIGERTDLQRLLRTQIEVISPETLVISEEFGDWEDSRRRIDLLGIDKDANIVVIELKRTEDGGHMELQALRYAAMVSVLKFDEAVDIYARYLERLGQEEDARDNLLDFLGWDSPDDELFAKDVRILLAATDFNREITSTVLWLRDHDVDIRCVRLQPYRDDERLLVDVQQVLPLPEAADYQIQIREKQRKEREVFREGRDFTRYRVVVGNQQFNRQAKRWAIFRIIRYLTGQGATPESLAELIPWRSFDSIFRKVDGEFTTEAEFIDAATLEADRSGRRFDPRRFFTGEDELIVCGGRTYCLTNQWGARTEEAMGLLIRAFPEERISYEID